MAITYSASANGTETTSNPTTASITAASGDTVLAYGNFNGTGMTGCTYGGSNLYMRCLGKVAANASWLAVYAITNVSSGSATINLAKTGFSWGQLYATSYQGVGGFGLVQSVTGTGTSASQAVTVPSGGMASQAFTTGPNGSTASSPTGGTNRILDNAGFAQGSASDSSSSSLTFGLTLGSSATWGGLYVPLLGGPLTNEPYMTDCNGLTSQVAGGTNTFNLNTLTGDYVFVDFAQTGAGSPTTVTCGGSNMSLATSSLTFNTSYIFNRYQFGPIASGGSKTISITATGGNWWTAHGVSVSNTAGFGTTTTSTGSSSSPSHAATLTANQVGLQGFGSSAAVNTSSGGAIIYENPANTQVFNYMSIADQSTTFSHSNTANWASVLTVLSPPANPGQFFQMF